MLYDLNNQLQAEGFKLRCNSLYGKKCIVELTEKKPMRTDNQNRYLHLILGYFASQYGCTLEYAKKNYFKILCNKELFVANTDDKYLGSIKTLRSSADLNTEELSTAIERFRNWSASEAGIYIPSPDEKEYLSLAEIEIEKNKNFI